MLNLYRIETPQSATQDKLFTELGLRQLNLSSEVVVVALDGERISIGEVLSSKKEECEGRFFYLASDKEILGSYEYKKLQEEPTLLKGACFAWTENFDEWKKVAYFPELEALLVKEGNEGKDEVTSKNLNIPTLPPPLPEGNFASTGYNTGQKKSFMPKRKKSLWQHFVYCLKQFAVFEGRASREEFWSFILFLVLGNIALNILQTATLPFINFSSITEWISDEDYFFISPYEFYWNRSFVSVYWLIFLLPLLAVTSRRLHDSGKSSWFLLFALLPVGGQIVLLIFALLPTTPYENAYGPVPTNEV